MTPSHRPKKKKLRGLTRTDAALDAMGLLGFSPTLVRNTLKQLLNEYGGDDGWVFIEESAYILLINTLLENNKDSSDNDTPAIENIETAGPSSRAIEPQISRTGDQDGNVKAVGDRNPAPEKDLTNTPLTQPSRLEAVLAPQKGRACHGWICDDDDHDPNDLVDLIPEPISESLKKLLRVRKRRILRWDVRPKDV